MDVPDGFLKPLRRTEDAAAMSFSPSGIRMKPVNQSGGAAPPSGLLFELVLGVKRCQIP